MIITVDSPNLLAALDFRGLKDLRPQMHAVIFDKSGALVATDGYSMFVGQHSGVAEDTVVEFSHKPPAKFVSCEVDTEALVVRYALPDGKKTEGDLRLSDQRKLDWSRAVNGNWFAPKPDCGATTTRINANLVQKASKALARFRKDGQMYILPSDNAMLGVKFALDEGPFILVMSMRLPGPKTAKK